MAATPSSVKQFMANPFVHKGIEPAVQYNKCRSKLINARIEALICQMDDVSSRREAANKDPKTEARKLEAALGKQKAALQEDLLSAVKSKHPNHHDGENRDKRPRIRGLTKRKKLDESPLQQRPFRRLERGQYKLRSKLMRQYAEARGEKAPRKKSPAPAQGQARSEEEYWGSSEMSGEATGAAMRTPYCCLLENHSRS